MPEIPQSPISHPVTGSTGTTGTSGSSTPLPFNPINGSSDGSVAVLGETNTGIGVRGTALSGTGVSGESNSHGIGVLGYSQGGPALLGQADAAGVGLLAFGNYDSDGPSGGIGSPLSMSGGILPAAITGLIKASAGFAAILSGKVSITDVLQGTSATLSGTLNAASAIFSGAVSANDVVLTGADCAEEFDSAREEGIEPGSVVVFEDDGALNTSDQPYNKRVAGVISGAGTYRPGVVLDRRISGRARAAVALVGKVYCKVDATYAPIEVGDLLTTSATVGCAMKATSSTRAFGAVIGKALAPHSGGRGLIPILVTMQ